MKGKNHYPKLLGLLRLNKTNFSAIIFRADGEVDPVAPGAVALDEQFVEIALGTVRDIQQDRSIANRLFKTCHAYIHSAARQMVARRCSSC